MNRPIWCMPRQARVAAMLSAGQTPARSAGFSRPDRDCIADFQIGRASFHSDVSSFYKIHCAKTLCRFGNLRYSRLGSLRYGDRPSKSPPPKPLWILRGPGSPRLVPEGHPRIAQRFNVGSSVREMISPEGTAEIKTQQGLREANIQTSLRDTQGWRRLGHLLFLTLALLILRQSVSAQTPSINEIIPPVIAPGRTNRVTLVGQNLNRVTSLWTSFASEVEIVPQSQPDDADRLTLLITPAAGTGGFAALRAGSTNGISNFFFCILDSLPTAADNGTNHTLSTAQSVSLPISIGGKSDDGAFDFYRFPARKGQRISVEVYAHRLGSSMDPLVRLLNAAGTELCYADDEPGPSRDSRFTFRIPATGDCILEIHDIAYQGGSQYRYQLRIGDFPIITAPYPLAIRSGKPEMVRLTSVYEAKMPSVAVAAPVDSAGTELRLSARWPGYRDAGFFSVAVQNLPPTLEKEPNDTPQTSTKIAIPGAIHGVFQHPGDRDFFLFDAKKDERWRFLGRSRSLGSACDLSLRILQTNGTLVAEANVSGPEAALTNLFTETGTYFLRADELSRRGRPDLVYSIEAVRLEAGFELVLDADKLEFGEDTVKIKVTAMRRDYTGPIALSIEAPECVFAAVPGGEIPEMKTEFTFEIPRPAGLAPGKLIHARIAGQATIAERPLRVTASTLPLLKTRYPLMLFPPAELDGLIGVICKPWRAPEEKARSTSGKVD